VGEVGAMFRVYHDESFLGVGSLDDTGALVPTRLISTSNQ